ncbi:MAG: urease accessory protein UreF [Rhodospirillaceae bacterium]|nr:urease accessory protein UreF [Rhodospirillaceae bacterium]|tara:strand:+ start:6366 stop:7064 length:699 start_codon:yes stop_codon:yes gene_type:complete
MTILTDCSLIRLQTWLSPNFPVGAFAYSHGLEYAVETGAINNLGSMVEWVSGIITFGSGHIDAGFFRSAYESIIRGDKHQLVQVVERADAQRATSEMALESVSQGRAFLQTLCETWPQPQLILWQEELRKMQRHPAYSVAVGVSCAVAEIPLRPALAAYLNATAANLVSSMVRLIPLGQTDGQRALLALEPIIIKATAAAVAGDAKGQGSAALGVDWMSIQHETQYTRLFRS